MIQRLRTYFFLRRHMKACRALLKRALEGS
jgi:hypothetical protein